MGWRVDSRTLYSRSVLSAASHGDGSGRETPAVKTRSSIVFLRAGRTRHINRRIDASHVGADSLDDRLSPLACWTEGWWGSGFVGVTHNL